jgi:MinD superfamily P-loop ATPase
MNQSSIVIQELVVVSGKGGTGKTTVTASLAALAKTSILADCDVDAANLELLTRPSLVRREEFAGGEKAFIDPARCVGCGRCARKCRFGAIQATTVSGGRRVYAVEEPDCEGCGVCAEICPRGAVTMRPVVGGEVYYSTTDYGPLVHARLRPGMGNSGKLATLVRNHARDAAKENGRNPVIIDGPPGVGCPAIASLTGATRALIVTEPTLSGIHDMKRVAELCRHFSLPACLCINKADINPLLSQTIRETASRLGIPVLAEIPTDSTVIESTRRGCPVVTVERQSPAAQAIRELWDELARLLDRTSVHSS